MSCLVCVQCVLRWRFANGGLAGCGVVCVHTYGTECIGGVQDPQTELLECVYVYICTPVRRCDWGGILMKARVSSGLTDLGIVYCTRFTNFRSF